MEAPGVEDGPDTTRQYLTACDPGELDGSEEVLRDTSRHDGVARLATVEKTDGDRVRAALDAARNGWHHNRDPRSLRRALLDLLRALEEEP